jgi:DNA-binding response OmpR family regulator
MNALVACDSENLNEFFALRLVGEGIKPYKSRNIDELFKFLDEKEIDFLLMDFDSDRYEEFETVKEIKAKHNNVLLILLTNKTGFDFAKRSMELGVYGFITKASDIESQFENLHELLESVRSKFYEKRKYMRVKPDNLQTNSAIMIVPGLSEEYQGTVLDISIGGVAIHTETDVSDMILFSGKVVDLKIELGSFQIKAKGQVVLKRGQDIGFRFKEVTEAFIRRLSEFVINHLE